jgi:hypothetical protein
MKNILFKANKVNSKSDLLATAPAPMCPYTGKPMKKVICGAHEGKQFHVWVSLEARLVLPVFVK